MIFWDEQDYVEMLYRQLLGRPPDLGGLRAHLQRFDGGAGALQAERTLEQIMTSAEARDRARLTLLPGLFDRGDSRPALVVSCGSDHYATAFTRRWSLKRFSGPFDWIASSPGMVAHALRDDFKMLLDPAQYEPVPNDGPSGGEGRVLHDHRFYRDSFGLRAMFDQYDPTGAAQHAYLTRCVERLRRVLASPHNKVFLLVAPADRFPDADHDAVVTALKARTAGFEVKMFRVEQADPNLPATRITETRRSEHLSSYRIEPLSQRVGADFPEIADEIALARAVIGKPSERLQSLDLPG